MMKLTLFTKWLDAKEKRSIAYEIRNIIRNNCLRNGQFRLLVGKTVPARAGMS